MSNLHDRGTLKGMLQRNSGNYNDLINKPAINGHTLIGNQSGHALGLANEDDIIYVEANPLEPATADLHKILVDDTIYSIPDVVVYGTASGAIASFDDGGDNKPIKSLKVAINPVQSGSGDPSPENVRPISGWDECKVTVADDLENPTVSNVYAINLNGTRYGGTLDVVSGVLTVDRAYVDLGTLTYTASNSIFIATIESGVSSISPASVYSICEKYKTTQKANWQSLKNGEYNYGQNITGQGRCIAIKDERYTSASDFKNTVNGVKFVYELATPQTYQLTPTQVKSLLGDNNIWSDTGEIVECVYQRDLNIALNKALNQ